MALVREPHVPGENDVGPFDAPRPFYVGSRVRMDGDSIQSLVRDWLEHKGFCQAGEGLVFSWSIQDGELNVTIAKHEASA